MRKPQIKRKNGSGKKNLIKAPPKLESQSTRINEDQKGFVLHYMLQHDVFAKGQIMKLGAQGKATRNRLYTELTARVNRLGPKKTVPQVKQLWTNMRLHSKHKKAELNRNKRKTGNPPPAPPLNNFDEKISILFNNFHLDFASELGFGKSLEISESLRNTYAETGKPSPEQLEKLLCYMERNRHLAENLDKIVNLPPTWNLLVTFLNKLPGPIKTSSQYMDIWTRKFKVARGKSPANRTSYEKRMMALITPKTSENKPSSSYMKNEDESEDENFGAAENSIISLLDDEDEENNVSTGTDYQWLFEPPKQDKINVKSQEPRSSSKSTLKLQNNKSQLFLKDSKPVKRLAEFQQPQSSQKSLKMEKPSTITTEMLSSALEEHSEESEMASVLKMMGEKTTTGREIAETLKLILVELRREKEDTRKANENLTAAILSQNEILLQISKMPVLPLVCQPEVPADPIQPGGLAEQSGHAPENTPQ